MSFCSELCIRSHMSRSCLYIARVVAEFINLLRWLSKLSLHPQINASEALGRKLILDPLNSICEKSHGQTVNSASNSVKINEARPIRGVHCRRRRESQIAVNASEANSVSSDQSSSECHVRAGGVKTPHFFDLYGTNLYVCL